MTKADRAVVIAAPAKVNLSLRVVGRRVDGYHEIDSPTVPVDLCDTVTVVSRNSPGNSSQPGVEGLAPADDLCLRAADLMAHECGASHGVDIRVEKRVPVGAGLGGGSSVAAAVLLACDRIWGMGWDERRLSEAGLALGADVPFFVRCRPARMLGIGERLEEIESPGGWFVVCVPAGRVSTSEAYRRHDELAGESPGDGGGGWPDGTIGRNDLEEAAVGLCPEVGMALDALRSVFGSAGMTGSGSACFAHTTERPGDGTLGRLRETGLEVLVAKTIQTRPGAQVTG